MRSFPPDGNSVMRGAEIRIEGTCLKNNKKFNLDRAHQRPVEKTGWGDVEWKGWFGKAGMKSTCQAKTEGS